MQDDSELLRRSVFTSNATMYGVDKEGKLFGGPIQVLYDILDGNTPQPKPAMVEITSIEIVNTAATGRIDINDIGGGYYYTDFMNLLKIDGEWRIVNKIFHTHASP